MMCSSETAGIREDGAIALHGEEFGQFVVPGDQSIK